MDDAQSLALGGLSLSSVERHELEGVWLALGRDQCSADLKRVRGTKRMSLDQAFGQAFYGVHRRHLEPPWPRVEELTACGGQLASSARVRTAAPRKCRENLHSGERPHHHTRIFA